MGEYLDIRRNIYGTTVGLKYGIHQKERNTNKTLVRHFLIRNVSHFYGLPLDLYRKRIAVLFAKCAVIFANSPQFGEMHCIFTGKAPQSLDCGTLQAEG